MPPYPSLINLIFLKSNCKNKKASKKEAEKVDKACRILYNTEWSVSSLEEHLNGGGCFFHIKAKGAINLFLLSHTYERRRCL